MHQGKGVAATRYGDGERAIMSSQRRSEALL
jgi:hypothetical protein